VPIETVLKLSAMTIKIRIPRVAAQVGPRNSPGIPDHVGDAENAGLENPGPNCEGGKGGTEKRGTMWHRSDYDHRSVIVTREVKITDR